LRRQYVDGKVVVHAIVHNFVLKKLQSAHSAQIATRGDANFYPKMNRILGC
jgi:hypothetical protein